MWDPVGDLAALLLLTPADAKEEHLQHGLSGNGLTLILRAPTDIPCSLRQARAVSPKRGYPGLDVAATSRPEDLRSWLTRPAV